MSIKVEESLKVRFPGLQALAYRLEGVKVRERDDRLEAFRERLLMRIRERYDLETLKDVPIFRAYREFFWRVGIDPTKVRPASEALIRRAIGGRTIPRINTLVDAYNLASMETEVALAAFDRERMAGPLYMRAALKGEEFLGIGMRGPVVLKGGEVVLTDSEKLVAIYPYRDAENTKITLATRNAVLLVCGVPGIDEEILLEAARVGVEYVTRFCGGRGIISP